MENQRDSKAPKPKSSDGFNSPINNNVPNPAGAPPYIPGFDPYASGSSNPPSPLMNYQRFIDPGAAAASPPVYTTQVKTEDGVIVMDAVNERNANRGGGEIRQGFTRQPSDYGTGYYIGGMPNSTRPSSSGISVDIFRNKTMMCHTWNTNHTCRFGSDCKVNSSSPPQSYRVIYAHSMEELRPTRLSGQQAHMYRPHTSSEGLSSPSSGTRPPLNLPAPVFFPSLLTRPAVPTTTIQVKRPSASTISSSDGSRSPSSGTTYPFNIAAEPFSLPSQQTRTAVPTTPIQVKRPSQSTISSSEGSSSSSSRTKNPLNIEAEPFSLPSKQTQTAVPTTPIQVKQPSESTISSTEGSMSSSSGTTYPFNIAAKPFSLPSQQTRTAAPTAPIQVEQPSEGTVISSTIPGTKPLASDWIPQDDGIEFPLPSSIEDPNREDVIAYMDQQYGTRPGKRLPVFEDTCPSDDKKPRSK
ncbi:hypothetical protein BUALT_Bualt15G0073900 [Buddleja alternifolia]|uniref:Uncharacterized protein n=1 Tax=Buddleja alternifolia TaxID=168488 RepID=A0AAV6WF73_9LAMI|nr:hypothetical protein BUALT_Bualt15G0073900 [Buddleja alternifolia]